jgi:uncharacterized SAM-binding protein YcdF (DUF218 family)
MVDDFLLRKAGAALLLPPISSLILVVFGTSLFRLFPRIGRAAALLGALSLAMFSLPVVSNYLEDFLIDYPALDLSQPNGGQAIVVLGGGVRRDAVEYGGDTLGRLTLERVRYGALVARRTRLPVLVTGGAVFDGSPEAVLMKRCLEDEFGVAVQWVEPRSRNTHENAVLSAPILARAGIQRIVLVAHSFDMRRAKAEFSDTGLQVIPAATGIPSMQPSHWIDWVPSVSALQLSYWALYELLANAVRDVNS